MANPDEDEPLKPRLDFDAKLEPVHDNEHPDDEAEIRTLRERDAARANRDLGPVSPPRYRERDW